MAKLLVLLVAASLACGAAEIETEKETSTVTEHTNDLEPIRASLAELLLTGAPANAQAELTGLVDELVALWDDEAENDEYRARVLARLEQDFRTAVEGTESTVRHERLRYEVAERSARVLSRESFALGKAVVDATIESDAAAAQGRALLERLEALRPRVSALVDAQGRVVVNRTLEDVFLEALYAVDRKAMSMRLGRYEFDTKSGKGGAPAPPKLAP